MLEKCSHYNWKRKIKINLKITKDAIHFDIYIILICFSAKLINILQKKNLEQKT